MPVKKMKISLVNFLRDHGLCINCKQDSLALENNKFTCISCAYSFPIVNSIPVLLTDENLMFPQHRYTIKSKSRLDKDRQKFISKIGRYVPNISINLSFTNCCKYFSRKFNKLVNVRILIVGGGNQRVWLDKQFKGCPNIELIYTDIDIDALVDIYCDAHELPFLNASFDAVITTAVLQHVANPTLSISEIHRVLKDDGLIYSEMAFMQQVVEGGYDFSRYTLTGHRRIFNFFDEIDSGLVAGPATVLLWAIENLVLAFFSNNYLRLFFKTLTRFSLFWIKYLDYFIKKNPQSLDGASCTFFLGVKRFTPITDSEIISRYRGSKHIEHI